MPINARGWHDEHQDHLNQAARQGLSQPRVSKVLVVSWRDYRLSSRFRGRMAACRLAGTMYLTMATGQRRNGMSPGKPSAKSASGTGVGDLMVSINRSKYASGAAMFVHRRLPAQAATAPFIVTGGRHWLFTEGGGKSNATGSWSANGGGFARGGCRQGGSQNSRASSIAAARGRVCSGPPPAERSFLATTPRHGVVRQP